MPAERGKPSGRNSEDLSRDTSPLPQSTIDAEYTRIREGVQLAMQGKLPPQAENPSQKEALATQSFTLLVKGRANEETIEIIRGKVLASGHGHFHLAFQQVARALAPADIGIAELPQGTQTVYGAVPLKDVQGKRMRFDVPLVEERKARQEIRRAIIVAALSSLRSMSHDLATVIKGNNELLAVRQLFPDEKEQHDFIRQLLLAEFKIFLDPETPKNGRELQLLQKLRGYTPQHIQEILKAYFSDEKRREEVATRRARGENKDE